MAAGTEVAKAFVTILPAMPGIQGKISSAFIPAAASVGDKAGSTLGSKLSTGLSGAMGAAGKILKGVGVAALGAATAAGGTVTMIGKNALDAYATWEQAVGGVDTLFKGASGTVQKYAADAYKTAGVSANEYMNQVTSFSASLISSLGGDVNKAADMGNMALTDMSDNANKMGTDLGSIQQTYQSMARGNYAMLDNLRLGYGGTKTEMQRMIDDANKVKTANGEMADLSIDKFSSVVEAIHIIQNQMGITGTTAREAATTIEGSVGAMKASWSNWLAELGKNDADMKGLTAQLVESVIIVGKNVAPRAVQIGKGLISGLSAAMGQLATYLPQPIQTAFNRIGANLTTFTANASSTVNKVLATFNLLRTGDFTSQFREAFNVEEDNPLVDRILSIRDTAIQAGTTIKQILSGIAPAIGASFQTIATIATGIFSTVITIVQQVATAFATAFQNNGGTISAITALASTILSLTSPLGVVRLLFTQFGGQLQSIAVAVVPMLTGVLTGLASMLGGVLAGLLPGVQAMIQAFLPIIGQIIMTVGQIATQILPMAISVITQLMPVITQTAVLIGSVIAILAPLIAQIVSSLLPVVRNVMTAVLNLVAALTPAITGLASIVISMIRMILPVVQTVLTVATAVVTGVISVIGLVITSVTNLIAFIAAGVSNVISIINPIVAVVSGVFQSIFAVANSVTSTIVSLISAGFNMVVNVIGGAVNAAGAAVSGFAGLVGGVFGNIAGTIGNTVSSAANMLVNGFNGMASAAGGMINQIGGQIGALPGIIQGHFAGAAGWLISAGSNIISGLWNGISGAIGGLYDNIRNALSGLVDAAKNALGIHSPSRVFRKEVGVMVGRGLALGLDDGETYVSKSMSRLNSTLEPSMRFDYGYGMTGGADGYGDKRPNVDVRIDARGTDPNVLMAMFDARAAAAVERW
ncbi:phage tail protein [Bifidobacterium simiiventris]|uniref:phage tail protein n=1 Tax=Bifidobacterium simiiventris TaxID=2834434 RepID=UPI001C567960|nr:hypothetical protein [Bifidobacterium simiiventris]MBW3077686.1 hypothetical protein [Bifidobacterium simiiventris]